MIGQIFYILFLCVQAKIYEDGLWTGYDVRFENEGIEVINGIPYNIQDNGSLEGTFLQELSEDWE